MVWSESGFAELDCIFVTNFPGDIRETWYVDVYEKHKKIQFIRFSESGVIRYTITLKKNSNTIARWEHLITSLNEVRNKFLGNYKTEYFIEEMQSIEKRLIII